MVENVRGEKTQPVRGGFAAIDALRQMFAGTALFAVQEEAKAARTLSAVAPPASGQPPDPPKFPLPPPMNPSATKSRNLFTVVAGWLALATAAGTPANGAEALAASAVIEGRVQNVATGQYLNNARVVVRGTELVAFTDETGTYRLPRVPAGSVTLDVFYTGLDAQSGTVQASPGQSLSRDFDLTSVARYGASTGVVKLDSFVVASSRETDGNAIAINEQRFAPNIMNVVSADEFGAIADGNVGEFMKFLPGIAIGYVGGDARSVAMNGVPSSNVPVTVGGFNLASAVTDGNTSRAVELEQVSINNISRVEVFHSPTPESPGSALAGGVNLVPRSAFERSKPQFNGSVSLMMRDNARSRGQTTASSGPQRKVQPGFDFSYVVPVNRRFGFTLSGSNSTVFTEQNIANPTRRGVSAATNPTAGLPDTLPSQPYLTDYAVWDGT